MKRWIVMAPMSAVAVAAAFFYFGSPRAHASHVPAAGKPHIAQWYDDAPAALSFTFDDGLQCHADIAAPMLHEFGFRGTFYVLPGLAREHRSDPAVHVARLRFGEGALSWDEIKAIHNLGMEIGNHSMFHNFLDRITDDAVVQGRMDHADDLIAEHVGERPLTFAFPYNEFTAHTKAMALKHHVAVRENWTDYGGPTFTTAFANGLVEKAIKGHAWLVPMIHGINAGFLPLSSAVLHDHLAFVKAHVNDVWVDTYADVARYQLERRSATLHVEDSIPGETTFFVSGQTPAQPVPLTVVVPLPLNDNTDDVDARDVATEAAVPVVREPDRILVNLPVGSTVTVSWH